MESRIIDTSPTTTRPANIPAGAVRPNGMKPLERFAGRRFHFVGAGGIGMSGLAKVLLHNKAIVTGSDMTETAVTRMLCAGGADIRVGHGYVPDNVDAVVISAAVNEDNPEVVIARERGVEVIKYAGMLGELMSCYHGIAVCGTHGKSTTTGWIAWLMKAAGLDPSFIVGADIPQAGTSSGVGEGKCFVAEACEYDRSFLSLNPDICVMLNIEQDHLDYYHDESEIVQAFADFAGQVKQGGTVVANGEDGNVARATGRLGDGVRLVTFGTDDKCDFRAANIEVVDGLHRFDIYRGEECLGRTTISLPGRHNVYNALATVATLITAGMPAEKAVALLTDFTGMDRRCMFKARHSGITVLDDYAHHPTEIRASLQGIRQRYKPERIFCVFQPHQYSRTRFLLEDFAQSFTLADVTIMPEIYFVRDSEQNRRLVNSQLLAERIRANGCDAVYIDSFSGICRYLMDNLGPGDLVVTMGAGDIFKVADEYIQWLRKDS